MADLKQWRAEDEARQEALMQELAVLNERRTLALGKLSEALTDAGVESFDLETVIHHADVIRDALQPFDSGVRHG